MLIDRAATSAIAEALPRAAEAAATTTKSLANHARLLASTNSEVAVLPLLLQFG
jgi:hypothetical protein